MKVYCLFEQSGTFKNEFKKLGVDAYDFDIQNEFGETDRVIDLFEEIRRGYEGKPSIFDELTADDLAFAFFPCTRFEAQISMSFRGEAKQFKNWTDAQKLEYVLGLHKEVSENYEAITKLALLAYSRNFRLIIENPANKPHYLTSYWPIKPAFIDKNRRENGDYYKKPTQYFFVNFEPKQTLLFEPLEEVEHKTIAYISGAGRETERSMIHPQYARRFIKQYIL